MAIYDRWWKTERQDGTRKKVKSAEHGCKERWQVRWRDEQGRQRKQSFERRLDAESADKTIQAQLLAGTYVDPAAGDVTFYAYAETWRGSRMHDPATAARIESQFRNHVYPADSTQDRTPGGGPAIGGYPMRVLAKRATLLQGWIKGMGAHPNTVRQIIGDVSQVFTAAVDDGIITRNPLAARSIQKPAAVRTKAVPWTASQVEAVAARAARPVQGAPLPRCGVRSPARGTVRGRERRHRFPPQEHPAWRPGPAARRGVVFQGGEEQEPGRFRCLIR